MSDDPSRAERQREIDAEYDDEEDVDDNDGRCFHCGGDGWVECWDPIQCTSPHEIVVLGSHRWQLCRCASCGGSGLAKDMTIW